MVQYWLCENVPFNNTQENVVGFDNQDQQFSFFTNLSVHADNSNFFRLNDNTVNFRVARSYEDSLNLNYMVVKQGGKTYYLFIDSVGYIDQGTTQVNATVDVWQTYMFDFEITDAFIKREHQDRFTKDMKPIYNLEVEDIELGDTYRTVNTVQARDTQGLENDNFVWYYVVTSGSYTDVVKYAPLSVGGVNMGYFLYALPLSKDGKSVRVKNSVDNEDYYFYAHHDIEELLKNPKVIAIYTSSYGPSDWAISKDSEGFYILRMSKMGYGNNSVNLIDPSGTKMLTVSNTNEFKKVFDFNNLKPTYIKPSVNTVKKIDNEPKLLTKPFTLYSFTNRSNEALELGANEWDSEIHYIESFGPQYKNIMYTPTLDPTKYYNGMQSTKNNEVPLLSDKYVNYIMNNKASATTGVALNGAMAGVGLGLATSGVGGLAMYMGLNMALSSSQKVVGELMRQRDLKQAPKSIREVGNNTVLQLEIDQYNLALTGSVRRPLEQFYNRAFEYMYRMGYKANRFGVPNIKSRYYFNYVEVTDIMLKGNLSQNTLTKIEMIFKNGVRIWHYHKDFKFLDYTYENVEVSLL